MSDFSIHYCDVCGAKLPDDDYERKKFGLGFSRRKHGPFLGIFFGSWCESRDEYELCQSCYREFHALFTEKHAEHRREIKAKLGLIGDDAR